MLQTKIIWIFIFLYSKYKYISFWLDRIKPLRSDNNMWFTWQVQQWSVTTKEVCYNESSQHMRSQQPEEKLFMTTCSGLSPVRSTVDRRRYLSNSFSEWQLDTNCENLHKFNFPMEQLLVVWEWQEMGQCTRVWNKSTNLCAPITCRQRSKLGLLKQHQFENVSFANILQSPESWKSPCIFTLLLLRLHSSSEGKIGCRLRGWWSEVMDNGGGG